MNILKRLYIKNQNNKKLNAQRMEGLGECCKTCKLCKKKIHDIYEYEYYKCKIDELSFEEATIKKNKCKHYEHSKHYKKYLKYRNTGK